MSKRKSDEVTGNISRWSSGRERRVVQRFESEPEARKKSSNKTPTAKEQKQLDAERRLDEGEPMARCRAVLDLMTLRPDAIWFALPVPIDIVPDYLEVIDTPSDYSTVRLQLESGIYGEEMLNFAGDMRLIYTNAVKWVWRRRRCRRCLCLCDVAAAFAAAAPAALPLTQ